MAFKGCTIAISLSAIIQSGGAAVASYVSVMNDIRGIYGEFKKYNASAEEYHTKVYKSIEAMRTNIFKRSGYLGNKINVKQAKELEKLRKEAKKTLTTLKDDLKTFGVKIGQLHRTAGDTSKKLSKALEDVDIALSVDPARVVKHRSKLMELNLDVQRIAKETKNFETFQKKGKKYVATCEETISLQESALKKAGKGLKGAGELVLEVTATMSVDIAATKAFSGDGLSLVSFLKGWEAKIDIGIQAATAIIKVF